MLNLSSKGKNTLLKDSAKGKLVEPPDTCGAEVGHEPLSRNHIPFPSPGDLPDPGIKPGSPASQADTLSSEPPRKNG